MKKLFALFCACVLTVTLFGCQKTPDDTNTDTPNPPDIQTETVNVYLPDGEAMYVIPTEMALLPEDDMAPVLVDTLINQGALPVDAAMNKCEVADGKITLDMNAKFADAVSQNGTAGETMLLAALVDTFLDYYDAKALTLTADGEAIETGHAVYDEPFTALFAVEPTP